MNEFKSTFLTIFLAARISVSVACISTDPKYLSQEVNLIGSLILINYRGFEQFGELRPFCDLTKFFVVENGTTSFVIFDETRRDCFENNVYCHDGELRRISYPDYMSVRLTFSPKSYTRLSSDFNVTNLASASNLTTFDIVFYTIKGIEILPNAPLTFLQSEASLADKISFISSNFVFYWQGRLLDEQACLEAVLDAAVANGSQIRVFANHSNSEFEFASDNNMGFRVCPLIFQDARIYKLSIDGLSRSKLVSNYFQFFDLSKTVDVEKAALIDLYLDRGLNSHVSLLQFMHTFNLKLDRALVNRYVFKTVIEMYFVGTLAGIETEFFKWFDSLTIITLQLANMRQFLQSGSDSNNKWMLYLDRKSERIMSRLQFNFMDIAFEYFYPDEDFCLFKYFPWQNQDKMLANIMYYHENLTRIGAMIAPSCTVQFIYSTHRLDSTTGHQRYTLNDIYNQSIADACNFISRLKICNQSSFESVGNRGGFYLNVYDSTYVLEWFDLLGAIVLFPIVCLLGFLSNLVVIIVLTRDRFKQDFEARLFDYLLANSVFNCIECVLNVLQLMSECISPNSIFCSEVRFSSFNTYMRVYLVGYFGEIMKTCSILTSLFFSLERLIASLDSKNKLLNRFTKTNFKGIIGLILVFSAISSVPKIFDFQTERRVYDNPTIAFEWPTQFTLSFENLSTLLVLYFLHFILNDFFFLLLNCLIDFCLLIKIKKNLNMKIKLKRKGMSSSAEESRKALLLEYSKKIKTERKTYNLLISSLVTYFVCRIPELCFGFFFPFYTQRYNSVIDLFAFLQTTYCDELSLCYLFSNTVGFLYMLSYTTNLYFYAKFNKTFRKNFLKFFRIASKTSKGNKANHSISVSK